MDALIDTAGRALASGDPLTALNAVALRDDAHALALRGIAMAQLGDLPRARLLLRRAARTFSPEDALPRARCTVAEAEIALVSRDLAWPPQPLADARSVLETHGDRANAAHARYLEARYCLLIGRLAEAENLLSGLDTAALATPSRAACALVAGGIAMRRLRITDARTAFTEARRIAERAGIPPLLAEIDTAQRQLDIPVARLVGPGSPRALRLDEIEALLASGTLVVDACRQSVCLGGRTVALGTRPVLFALARTLAEAWPASASREELLARAFRAREADDSHRARLRVEIGRLRKALEGIASIAATRTGFALTPTGGRKLAVIAPPADEAHAPVLALLADGEAWSSSALALALGASQRTLQRALDELAAGGKVQAVGQGPARRWVAAPVPGFPTALLLPSALHGG
jgi:tetratricopeptide (TPR) repeat protein